MAQAWQAFPSATSTGVNSVDRTFVEPPESIGTPSDPAAVDVTEENSAFALLRGIAGSLDIPVGTGIAPVNANRKILPDAAVTLGERDDALATDAGRHSAISFMKAILEVSERA